MAVVTAVPEPNLWNEICKDYETRNPALVDELESVNTDLLDFDPAKHSPVFYGAMHTKLEGMDEDAMRDIDPAVSHPAAIGHAFIDRPPPPPPKSPPPAPDYKSCPPRTYLETYIFPTLMPALQSTLITAKQERCFERKRTRFNALDYLTEKLYYSNPLVEDRDEDGSYLEIDFVKEYLEQHPRDPLPLSLLWTEEEATLVIQSWWRGYVVRREPEVQELRQWQKMWREDQADVTTKVSDFWANRISSEPTMTISSHHEEDREMPSQNDGMVTREMTQNEEKPETPQTA